MWYQDYMILPACQALFAPIGVNGRGRADCWNLMDWAAKPQLPCPAVSFFSVVGGPVEPLSFSLRPDCGHTHNGGGREATPDTSGRILQPAVPIGNDAAWQYRRQPSQHHMQDLSIAQDARGQTPD